MHLQQMFSTLFNNITVIYGIFHRMFSTSSAAGLLYVGKVKNRLIFAENSISQKCFKIDISHDINSGNLWTIYQKGYFSCHLLWKHLKKVITTHVHLTFWRICSRRLLKTLWQTKKLFETSNFSFSQNVFNLHF